MGVNSFFNKLVSYGGISINDGILRIWKDPNIFFEKSVYTTFHLECYQELGEDFEDLLYVIGKMTGYSNSVTLGEFFGLNRDRYYQDDHTDADMFMNGATQDGWGEARITKYPEHGKKVELSFEIRDKEIPFEIIKKYNINHKIRYHSYVTGIIAAGSKYLVRKECDAYEDECKCNNESLTLCRLSGKEVESELVSKLLTDLGLTIKGLYETTEPIYKTRKYVFKPFTIFKINFGDGTFKIKNYSGSVMAVISYCIILYVLKKRLSEEKYFKIFNEISKVQIAKVKMELKDVKEYSLKSLKKILEEISLFGYGNFEVTIGGENNKIIFISNKNNPFAKDFLTIFGKQNSPVDDYLSALFVNIFSIFFNLNATCEETNCLAKQDNSCVFKIILK